MNDARRRHAVAAAHGRLYAFGGEGQFASALDTVEYYDYTFDNDEKWTSTTPMNNSRVDLAGAVINGKVYATGGYSVAFGVSTVLSTVERFDPTSDNPNWTDALPMKQSRFGHAACGVQGETEFDSKIYVLGGREALNGPPLNTVEVYDFGKNTWTNMPAMNKYRTNFAVAVVDNVLYAIGGHVSGVATNSVESLDLTNPSASWMTKASMIHKRQGHTVAVIKGTIVVIGGASNAPTEIYDGVPDRWKTFVPFDQTSWFSADVVVNDKLYRTGGAVNATIILNYPYLSLSPATKTVTVHNLGFTESWRSTWGFFRISSESCILYKTPDQ